MKVEKTSESFHILGYLLELIIKIWRFEKNILKIREFGSLYLFHEKSFV
jgi:hypothetical protein